MAATAGGDDVKLLGGWASPFAMRPRIALNLKGVEYEFMEEDCNRKSELLLESNPVHKKIPALIHAGKPICESLVIVQHIDEVWTAGPSILPSDPYQRAIARFWAAFIDDRVFTTIVVILKAETKEGRIEAAKQLLEGLQLLEAAFEKCSKGKGFFGGNAIGFLDIALGSFVGWLKVVEKMVGIKILDEEKIPLLVGWTERFCSDDAVKELMQDTDKLVEFAKLLQAKMKAASI